MDMQSVGLREFRSNLHRYTRQAQEPMVITSHGEAIGYYIPARPHPQEHDMTALREAARRISALLAAGGITEDTIVADFQEAQQADAAPCVS